MSHALLSPSAASRWLNCTPSARLEEQFPDRAGAAAAEGTTAHALAEILISQALGTDKAFKLNARLKEVQDSSFYNEDMHEHCDNYVALVLERYAEAQRRTKDPVIFLERRIDLSAYVPEGFGTGDAVIIADGLMDIIDLKYGKGVPVSAIENKQMMLYALGLVHEFELIYLLERVRMTIYQPRIDNVSSFEMAVDDLKRWAEDELKPKAAMAFAGIGEYQAGSHCQFCKAKGICRAFADYNLVLARHEFKQPELLNDEEVAEILDKAATFTNWLNAVKDHALSEALNGKEWPGYKLVEGRSNRKFTDEEQVAGKLMELGYKEEDIYNKKLQGITALEKMVGKAAFTTHLGGYTVKPPGAPTLVPQSDKRPAINSEQAAKAEFADVETNL